MLIAGEPSGDALAAELVNALREELAVIEAIPTTDYQPLHASLDPRFFGTGGPLMSGAGVDLVFDVTSLSAIGPSDALEHFLTYRALFQRLYQMALDREPSVIICVDFGVFNLRFATAIKDHVRPRHDWFHDWQPKIIQFVSPQVWASREGRARRIARDYDLLLSIFPFEKEWYTKRVPQLRVEYVGNPIVDRYAGGKWAMPGDGSQSCSAPQAVSTRPAEGSRRPVVLLLPGSRPNELRRHLPVMLGALALIRVTLPNVSARMVLPSEALVRQAQAIGLPSNLEVRNGSLAESLAEADVAIASTGTVTLECAYFGVPTVALYRTDWITYQIGRRIVTVKYAAMPNLLAHEEIFPEFIQDAATPERIARAALELLRDEKRRAEIRAKLARVVASLGEPGASRRAARAITALLENSKSA